MLSPKPPIPSPTLFPNLPTSPSLIWHSPVLGHMIFERPRASPPTDGRLGHPIHFYVTRVQCAFHKSQQPEQPTLLQKHTNNFSE